MVRDFVTMVGGDFSNADCTTGVMEKPKWEASGHDLRPVGRIGVRLGKPDD